MIKLFISEDIPYSLETLLCSMGFKICKLKKEPNLPLPVSAHADMLIFGNDKTLVTTQSYYNNNIDVFGNTAIETVNETFGSDYPYDIIFNAFVLNDTLYGKINYLSPSVAQKYENHINLKQGYAKCSCLIFGNNVITADTGIYNTLKDNRVNVLKISEGNILLPGYNYGFIGGSSFVYNDKIIFFGDVTLHPDYNEIKEFITSQGYRIIFDNSFQLTDFGGAVIDKTHTL